MNDVQRFIADEMTVEVSPAIETVGRTLAARLNGIAVLFYGSSLRTGDLEGVLDFYVLIDRPSGTLLRRTGMRWLWPDVSFHEVTVDGQVLRAKVATMPIETFELATRGSFVDTTIWARFVQPAGLLWAATTAVERRVIDAVSEAVFTAARFAAVLGPKQGSVRDYWLALFRETYCTEMRVEPPGREQQILVYDPGRYDRLLPLAWDAAGIDYTLSDGIITPRLRFDMLRSITQAWLARVRVGKALNLARLVKATFTFDGAARYGLWKLQRHTGIEVALTPWRERHPVLAAPGVLWRVLRTQTP
jgi:hypothetical protein